MVSEIWFFCYFRSEKSEIKKEQNAFKIDGVVVDCVVICLLVCNQVHFVVSRVAAISKEVIRFINLLLVIWSVYLG